MRLEAIDIKGALPVETFRVQNLADVIVIAGPNGVGKTRLVQTLMSAFRNPNDPSTRLIVAATSEEERTEWNQSLLDTSVQEQAIKLQLTIQKSRKRTHWQSSVFQFESDRTNPQYNSYGFSWEVTDPDDELLGWDFSLQGLRSRYSDTIGSLFRKVHSQNDAIAKRARELMASGGGFISPDDFPDPIAPFKEAFRQLLAPKELVSPDPKDQTLYFTYNGSRRFPVGALSSGEREVMNIAFDFLMRDPSDSIVVFDEPELHLHPELSYRLLHTLRNAGTRNQFIFVTHSPDIITASLEHSVLFITPPRPDGGNQAVVVSEDDTSNEALKLIGQSIGIVSLGRRLVLIEGAQTSLDKQTYGAVLRNKFPNLVLVPSGGRGLIQSFHQVVDQVLSKTIWGVDFFMLCDRDALPPGRDSVEVEDAADGRLKVLGRYHLENYFLNENVLARCFEDCEPPTSWLRDPMSIKQKLEELAHGMLSYATALIISARFREHFGNLDLMVKGCHNKSLSELTTLIDDRAASEVNRFTQSVDKDLLGQAITTTYDTLKNSLTDNTWKIQIPGKPILEQFAAVAKMSSSRLKLKFLHEAENVSEHPFQDVIDIFSYFSKL